MRIVLSLLASVTALLITACTTNISGDPRYETGFLKGQTYVLQQDLHGIPNRNFGRISYISVLSPKAYEAQLTSNQYARWRGKPALFVSSGEVELVGIEKGTEILVTQVILDHTGDGTEMILSAEFASGAFKGKNADLMSICRHKAFPGAGMFASLADRDPEFLAEKNTPILPPKPVRD